MPSTETQSGASNALRNSNDDAVGPASSPRRCKHCGAVVEGDHAARKSHGLACRALRIRQSVEKLAKPLRRAQPVLHKKPQLAVYDEAMSKLVERLLPPINLRERRGDAAADATWMQCPACGKRLLADRLRNHQSHSCVVTTVTQKLSRLKALLQQAITIESADVEATKSSGPSDPHSTALQERDATEKAHPRTRSVYAALPKVDALLEEARHCLAAIHQCVNIRDLFEPHRASTPTAASPTAADQRDAHVPFELSMVALTPTLPQMQRAVPLIDERVTKWVSAGPKHIRSVRDVAHAPRLHPDHGVRSQTALEHSHVLSASRTSAALGRLGGCSSSCEQSRFSEDTLMLARAICDGRITMKDALEGDNNVERVRRTPYRDAISPENRN